MEFTGKNIVVIGGSGVLGAELVRQLSAQGAKVMATARNAETAAKIPAEATLKLVVDLEIPESIKTLTDYLLDANTPINGIINAAGVVGFAKATETSPEDSAKLMQINNLGPAAIISALHPLLVLDKDTESFVAAFTGVVSEKVFPGMSSYTVSKTAHASYLATITQEFRRDKIQVTDAKPGHTETGLASRAIFGTAPAFPEGMSASHVVTVLLNGIKEGKAVIASTEF
ncbi:MAG: SDR family NAD(P)-dependent oxidoreductase [Rhodoluna sp.]|jgi:cyclic-di-GMP-binding biofilm dispersal mediator protein|nr:SDR family NAD(P)-dependent oxidoreductase [Rhodoluna sp.]